MHDLGGMTLDELRAEKLRLEAQLADIRQRRAALRSNRTILWTVAVAGLLTAAVASALTALM